MKVILIRHTSVGVPPGTCYGQTDVPLNTTFEEEAEIIKQNLQEKDFDKIYSSPLTRCRKLAEYCGYEKIDFKDSLKEINFGEWEMKPWDSLPMKEWEKDWVNTPAPSGESFEQIFRRVSAFFEELKKQDYQSVAIFTHGGVMCCARIYFGQAEMKEAFNLLPKHGEAMEFIL
ncbi:MAG: alpha-ribazole phosphatase [Odoribacter sp.]|nr:alpha-ribazole phosphatase [Odoribacter sp.]